MSRLQAARRFVEALACASALLALAAGGVAWGAARPHPHIGKLPGFPVLRGVVPVLGSQAAVSAHEQLVKSAFAAARAEHPAAQRLFGLSGSPVNNESEEPLCVSELEEELTFETQDVCYRGGPVVRDPQIHLIFWQGLVEEDISKEPHVKLFPPHYIETVERYFEGLAHDGGATTNVFAVDSQYGDENQEGVYSPGEYAMSFEKATDVNVDTTTPFPTHCSDVTQYSEGPCLLDSDIQKEVETVAGSNPEGLHDIYVVLTPPGVGGCFGGGSTEDCAYKQYCAYHGDFGGDGMTSGDQTLYADLPYLGEVAGCDSGVHPNEPVSAKEEKEAKDAGADAVIDTASHEINETITDPIGSQCDEENKEIIGCEANAWTDAIGQEIADKCLPPESTIDGIYGGPLGELLPSRPASSYNQLIDGQHYWTQRVWSNEAGVLEGGCVQRMIEANILVSSNAAATVPVTFDGSASGAPGDPAVYWVWNFGGEQVGTSSPRITRTYAKPGEYLVTLTAYDAYGNARATLGILTVGSAPPSPPVPVISPTSSVPVKELEEVKVPVAVAHYSSAQIAALLGLPAPAAKLSGLSSITFGHASCPPACAVALNLYTKVTSRKHHHQVLIGKLANVVITRAQQSIVLKLNGIGRRLLRAHRRLAVTLKLSVVGHEGASWSISRSLTLTG